MKKIGFTLAEVLITLGIIGVVAALTAPALVQNAGTAKIGPTLSKVVSTLENANEQLLHDEDATDISKIAPTTDEYMEKLSKYISGSSYPIDRFTKGAFTPASTWYDKSPCTLSWDGSREFKFSDNISLIIMDIKDIYRPKGSFKGDYRLVYVDINGPQTAPNSVGRDIFQMRIDKGGQIVLGGSTTGAWLRNNDKFKYTATTGDYACNETTVGKGYGCAGSIFENNFKVIYQ